MKRRLLAKIQKEMKKQYERTHNWWTVDAHIDGHTESYTMKVNNKEVKTYDNLDVVLALLVEMNK